MAITKESQILKIEDVKKATNYLDEAAKYLNSAKENLLDGKKYAGANAITIGDKAVFESSVNALIDEVNSEITTITDYSSKILKDANTFATSERNSYNAYLKQKAEAEKATNRDSASSR